MKPHCLVIEDDSTLQAVYRFILQRMQFDLTFAKDGKEALDILSRLTPHLVFLDIRLPYISGLEVLQHMRTDGRFRHTRIVITSSLNDYDGSLQNEEFILKPMQPTEITRIANEIRESVLHLA
jgi:CheY-like chemotaxis protein